MRWSNSLTVAIAALFTFALLYFASAQSIGPGTGGSTGGGSGTVTSATITAGTNVTTSGTCTSTTVLNCTINATSAVSSVSDSGAGTLTISPNAGAVLAALNLNNANTWTGIQTFTTPVLGVASGTSLALSSAGAAATPSLSIGNAGDGFYSVSTTGFGLSVGAASKMDFGITTGSAWNFTGAITTNGSLNASSNITLSGSTGLVTGPTFKSAGNHPTSAFAGGTCAGGSLAGGATAGTATLTGACAATNTWTLSVMPTTTTGYACTAEDRTTPTALLNETSTSTGGAVFTFSGTTGATDVIQFQCLGY